MAAFGTKKPSGDVGVQLQFPSVFKQFFDKGYAYYPSEQESPMQLLVGTDFQSQFHEEKRQYANKTVMDGLQARRTAERLLLTGMANYHLPKPVLGQRKFANPSYGQLGIESARRDGSDAPFSVIENGGISGGMRGGVVKTAEGYDFYSKQLRDRINQLDRINALTLGYTVSQGQSAPTADNTREGSVSKVSFFITLRALADAISSNDVNRFTFENLKDLLRMLFSISPTADLETLNDTAKIINIMVTEIRALESGNGRLNELENEEYIETIGLFVEGMRRYTDEMIRSVNMSDRDKLTLSKSLIKNLGFDRLMPKKTPQAVIDLARTGNERINQAAEDFDADDDMNDDDNNDGKFDKLAPTREDDEARGMPSAPFAGRSEDPNRAAYGRKGRVVSERPAFFNDDTPVDVAPLDIAGSDPNAEIPAADTSSLVESLKSAMEEIKYEVFDNLTPEDADKDLSQLLEEQDINPKDYISILEDKLQSAGLSKGDIATAMQISNDPVFTSYVSENLAQGRVPPPIRHDRPSGVPAPVVRWEPAPVASSASLKGRIDNATSKEELQQIWRDIPESQKRGIKKPHGNSSVKNLKKILYGLV